MEGRRGRGCGCGVWVTVVWVEGVWWKKSEDRWVEMGRRREALGAFARKDVRALGREREGSKRVV